MPPKLVALIAAAALTTGWLLASGVSPPVAELQELPDRIERTDTRREVPPETPFTEQLHLKLRSAPAAPVPRRNPFVFGGTAQRAMPQTARATDAVAPSQESTTRTAVKDPALRLSGIGVSAAPGGVIRTAVVSDGTTVHLLKVGEAVAGFTLIDITDDTVVIQDASGARWALRLK